MLVIDGFGRLEETIADALNFGLTREKDKNVSLSLVEMDIHHGARYLGHVCELLMVKRIVRAAVVNTDGKGATGNCEDGTRIEKLGELGDVQGCRHDHYLEGCFSRLELGQWFVK